MYNKPALTTSNEPGWLPDERGEGSDRGPAEDQVQGEAETRVAMTVHSSERGAEQRAGPHGTEQ